jgi:hypothetical protein
MTDSLTMCALENRCRMGTGEHFGSAALVHPDWQRRRGVKAIARCELFELHRQDVMSICQQYPSLRESNPSPQKR